ncbi:hypothetical protein BpHYR1_014864 [Brachionus plicatilis]|uniref:Uncharacterized protein n=1 Tax=Brachionus plicatilis TaxID=10195 RepID=A0A3M7PN62_BRAPC|nr:hypothetical protein BpHYR1_014864 [Brachionus plicatilis]
MTTVNNKEFIGPSPRIPLTGFTEKPINRLASTRLQPNILTIETNHVKRDIKKNVREINPLLEYQLWLEAGKMDKSLIKSINSNESLSFNSNIWRNYRSSAGLYEEKKSGVSESIASLYPVNIPPPSQIGSNSLKRYYEQNKSIFKSEEAFKQAMDKVDKEATLMKYLRLKSEMRNPPLDYDGNILPPKNFRKYPPLNRKNNLEPVEDYNSRSYPHLGFLPAPKIEPSDSFIVNEKIKIDATRIRMKRFMPLKTYTKKPNVEQITDERITGNTFSKSDSIK